MKVVKAEHTSIVDCLDVYFLFLILYYLIIKGSKGYVTWKPIVLSQKLIGSSLDFKNKVKNTLKHFCRRIHPTVLSLG
jgi:hypothetical protein